MASRVTLSRRWLTTATWPLGVTMTSWDYMWRTTVLRRTETVVAPGSDLASPPPLPDAISRHRLQLEDGGHGPLFHRFYRVRIKQSDVSPMHLMGQVQSNLNLVCPTKFARFVKVVGDDSTMAPNDEYVVRMAGPWDGPVRVVDRTRTSFRLVTLTGHLEAGQIEFRARRDGQLVVEIESWARSKDFVTNLLYHHLRMSKEVQLHMWISFLEKVVALAGGRIDCGVEIRTHRVADT